MSIKLRSWHRRLGMLSAFFVISLSVTGLLLNHTLGLQLDNTPVRSKWVHWLYGIDYPDRPQYVIALTDTAYVSQWGRTVYINEQSIASCPQLIAGVVTAAPSLVVLACEQRILLFTEKGELIDQIDETQGVPGIIDYLVTQDEQILVKIDDRHYRFDADQLQFTPWDDKHDVMAPIMAMNLPLAVEDNIKAQQTPTDISLERFILDLHSGRILGDFGVYLTDAMAVLFLFIAVTGLWIWRRRP